MTTREQQDPTPPAPLSGPPRGDRCECPARCGMPFYAPGWTCVCGEEKDHYHCTACMGIAQAG